MSEVKFVLVTCQCQKCQLLCIDAFIKILHCDSHYNTDFREYNEKYKFPLKFGGISYVFTYFEIL